MTQVTYYGNSPYAITPQVTKYIPYLDFWSPPTVAISATDVRFTITTKYQHRPDLLSNDTYGTPSYWWVFAVRNPDIIKDPIYDMVPGISIYLPSPSSLPSSGA
jgi:hypothetical protein